MSPDAPPSIANTRYATVPVDTITLHPQNPRRGDVGAIHGSLDANGFFGTIVVQESTGHVLVGNHRLKAARQAGMPEVPVTYVDVDDTTALRIMLADNRTAELATNDDDQLAELLQELARSGNLEGSGYDGDDVDTLLADIAASGGGDVHDYTTKVESPVYEPSGEQPPVSALYDPSTSDKLLADIDGADLPGDVRLFLAFAAGRHVRFDYEAIANYYAHAEPHVQRLMEASALVIIDYEQAVERGFVRLHETVDAAFSEDYPDA